MMPSESELLAHVFPIESYEGEDCHALVTEAHEYIAAFDWANPGRTWVGECIPGVIGIFLVELKPTDFDIDPFTWVIVGDLPPAYISPVYAASPRDALDGYIAEMAAWVEAAEKEEPVGDLIPVNAAPTRQNAEGLKDRLEFLRREILPHVAG
jgi:hypothetical protein